MKKLLLLVLFITASCAPAKVDTPTATSSPTETFTPIVTAPTATVTQIPTSVGSGGELSVPLPDYFKTLTVMTEPPQTAEDLAAMPVVKMEDVTSGAFAEWILQQAKPFPPNSYPLRPIPREKGMVGYGYGPAMDLAGHADVQDIGMYLVLDKNGKRQFVLTPQVVVTGHGPDVLMAYGPLAGDPDHDLVGIDGFWENILSKSASRVMVPVVFDNREACRKAYTKYPFAIPDCYNYLEKVQPQVVAMIKEWAKGDFPHDFATLPVLVTALDQ